MHLPDYDPVGLSDYLRLRGALAERVSLFVPSDLEERFAAFGNRKLITEKARNRALLEQLDGRVWPCEQSRRVYGLIKESGSGLEQECLLVKLKKVLWRLRPHESRHERIPREDRWEARLGCGAGIYRGLNRGTRPWAIRRAPGRPKDRGDRS